MTPGTGDDEVLETGRPHARRRTALVPALAVLLAGAVWLGMHGGPGNHHGAPTSPVTPPASASVGVAPVGAEALGPVEVPAAVIGPDIYTVDHGVLTRYDVRTGAKTGRRIHPRDEADYQVVADPVTHRIWVVSTVDDITVYESDSRTLAPLSVIRWNGQPTSSALLDGRFYLATQTGVLDLPFAAGRPRLVAEAGTAYGVAADPSRHRLLRLYSSGGTWQLAAWVPGSPTSIVAPAPFAKGGFAAVGGQFWAAGFGDGGAVLARLDPATLGVSAYSPLEPQLDPGALIVASDERHLLVQAGNGDAKLWCLDGRTGAVQRSWPSVPGTPLLVSGQVYELTAHGPQRLSPGAC